MKKCISYSFSLLLAVTLILSVGKNALAANEDTYNIKTETKTASTTSPYFTETFINDQCYKCTTSANPQAMTVACDICKTLTVTETKITTYNWFDSIYLIGKILFGFAVLAFMINFRRKKK